MKYLLTLLIFSFATLVNAQDYYAQQWAKVDSLQQIGENRSAYEIVQKILIQAKDDRNQPQQIKALLHKGRMALELEEEATSKVLAELNQFVNEGDAQLRPLLHSVLGELYWRYFTENRWQILNRTNTNIREEDVKTWDTKKILAQAAFHYRASVADEATIQKIPLAFYQALVLNENARLRPTLYDFLVHRALNYFSDTSTGLSSPKDQFAVNHTDYFVFGNNFATLTLPQETSVGFDVLQLYQKLIQYRLADENREALADVDLKRIQFLKEHANFPEQNAFFLDFWERFAQHYSGTDVYVEALFEKAKLLVVLGKSYSAQDPQKRHKNALVDARTLAQDLLRRFPKHRIAPQIQNFVTTLEAKVLQVSVGQNPEPNKAFPLRIAYQNVDKAYFKFIKISVREYLSVQEMDWERTLAWLAQKRRLAATARFQSNLPNDGDLQLKSTQLIAPALPFGIYLVFGDLDGEFNSKLDGYGGHAWVQVSDISVISRKQADKRDFTVLHRTTGQPLTGARITSLSTQAQELTPETGRVLLKMPDRNRNYRREGYKIEWRGQTLIERVYDYPDWEYSDNTVYKTFFFTDRTLYRPGQKVFFKGIVLKDLGGENQWEVVKDRKVKVGLFNVNGELKGTLEPSTNDNGAFSGEFVLPEDGLMGNFSIRELSLGAYSQVDFSVEEYKRPKFEVKALPLEGTAKLGEMVAVKVQATSFAGAPIADAEVKFRVQRGVDLPRWCWWWNPQPPTEIAFGTVKTGQDGIATLLFLAKPDPTVSPQNQPQFTYTVNADVTDISGETRGTETDIRLAFTAFQLNTDIGDNVSVVQSPKVKVSATNFAGTKVPSKGKLSLAQITNPNRILRTRQWEKSQETAVSQSLWMQRLPLDWYNESEFFEQEGNVIFRQDFDTEGDGIQLPNLAQGWYLLKVEAQDKDGNRVENKQYFVRMLPEAGATLPQAYTFKQLNPTVQPGDIAKFIIGSAFTNVRVQMDIEEQGEIVKTSHFTLNNNQKLIEIPVEEKHRGNFSVHFSFIRHNRQYLTTALVQVPFSNKELEISTEVFRDKLYPGQAEEWRLKIRGKKGEKVAAEMVASLYDASLDALGRPNSFNMSLWNYRGSRRNWESSNFGLTGLQQERVAPYLTDPGANVYPSLNWFGWEGFGGYHNFYRRDRLYAMPAPMMVDGAVAESANQTSAVPAAPPPPPPGDDVAALKLENALGGSPKPNLDAVAARRNLNETAFFFPHLKTDAEGNVILSFTMPEALTKWKLLGLAHNPNLQVGTITKEVVTQKDLMVTPNAPRFFRENDAIQFVAKIDNMTDAVMQGEARLQLFNALNDAPVDALFNFQNNTVAFEAGAKGSTTVRWNLQVPQTLSAVKYRIVAASGTFSDGEENVLPIVPNRMMVTESLPLPVRGAGTTNFTFDKLRNNQSTTLQHHALTVEFTPNPVWYAVQALPYLSEFPYECAEQTFTRYFANRLSRYIIDKNPRIKDVFERWKNESPESFLSKLEQNQELKNAILSETPWVMEAANEAERKRRIALLFDVRRMSAEENRALTRLLELQNGDGGWSWFKGMESNPWMTQHIVTGFGQLRKLGVDLDPRITESMQRALQYVDAFWVAEYQRYKKEWEQSDNVSALHWLYMRSFFVEVERNTTTQEVLNFWLDKAEKHWVKLDVYSQGLAALALNRFERNATAKQILVSLKQRSINNAELGRYWNYQSGWYWYQAPVETHSLMIEAFHEINNDQEMVEDLKVWLLKNKQTNDWKTTKATAAAIYALLLRGSDLINQNQTVNIRLGNYEVVPDREEAGTGYFKKRIEGEEVDAQMGNVSVQKTGNSVAWGAVYWQYFEQLDKITPAQTPLSLEKHLTKEVITENGAVLEPITENTPLKVGDRVKVRVVIRTDRDMEYVHLKDMRASGFEPENVFSGYRWQDGLGYYESTKDLATHFFIDWLRKGTYVLEYPVRVTHNGTFSNGITTLQCMYAPEFSAHSAGVRVVVE